MNSEQILVQQKREEFRNEIRQRRNEQLFKRKRMTPNSTTSDTLIQVLQQLNVENEESALQAISLKIPQKIINTIFKSEVSLPYAIEFLKNDRLLLMEALYFFNSLSANATSQKLEENMPQTFMSYLIQLYITFHQVITQHQDITFIIDYLDCIFYNVLLSGYKISTKDKEMMINSIQKEILNNNFHHFSLQAQETMLALYTKLFNEYDASSLSICTSIFKNYKQSELLLITVRLIIKAIQTTAKQGRKQFSNVLNYIKQQNFHEQLLGLMIEFPNIVIEYFKHVSNYQSSISCQLIEYKHAYLIYQNWRIFDKANIYYFLACILITYKMIITDILQNKQLLDEILNDIQTKQDRESKEAFYLLCQMIKENENLSANNELVGIINQYFINCNTIEEYKFYLELISFNPQFVLITCPNKIKAKIESLIRIPELETLVKRVLD